MSRYLRCAFAFCLLAGIAACDRTGDDLDEAAQEPQVAHEQSDDIRRGTLGPLTYSFDDNRFDPVEVMITIPPNYENSVFASKLIPADRTDTLGEESCFYGEQGKPTICEAAKEAGLSMALLERPLTEYRQAFTEAKIAEEELESASLDGAEGFAFTAEAEGRGVEYNFLGVNGRTLLLARHFEPGRADIEAGVQEVLRSIAISLRNQRGA